MLSFRWTFAIFTGLAGAFAGEALINGGEVGNIGYSNLLGHLGQFHRSGIQQLFGAVDSDLIEVFGKIHAGLLAEHSAEIGGIDRELVCQGFQGEITVIIVLMHIFQYKLNPLGIAPVIHVLDTVAKSGHQRLYAFFQCMDGRCCLNLSVALSSNLLNFRCRNIGQHRTEI